MSSDMQCNADLAPVEEAQRLLIEALRLLDGSQAHLAAAYTATALDALARFMGKDTVLN